jgi:heptosyltransferase-2
VSLLVGSGASAGLFKYNPEISETIVFDKKGLHRSVASFLKLWNRLRRNEYDLVINFQRSNLKTWF